MNLTYDFVCVIPRLVELVMTTVEMNCHLILCMHTSLALLLTGMIIFCSNRLMNQSIIESSSNESF